MMEEISLAEYKTEMLEKHSATVVEQYWAGTPVKEIAANLGIGVRSVHNILHVAGGALPKREGHNSTLEERDPERYEQMAQLVDEGLSAGIIAKQTGTKRETVIKLFPEVNRRKVKPVVMEEPKEKNFGAISQETLDWIGMFVEDETPISEIAKTTGVSASTIKKYYPNAGVGVQKGASVRAMLHRFEQVCKDWGV